MQNKRPFFVKLYICFAVFFFVSVLILTTIIYCSLYFLAFLFFVPKSKRESIGYQALRICDLSLHFFLRIKYNFENEEYLDLLKKNNVKNILIVANHTSCIDISTILLRLKDFKVGFITKKNLFYIPFFNFYLFVSGCIPLDRSDIRSGLKAIKKGTNAIKEGKCMLIFPEGTRSKTGKVAEFKKGSFKMAELSKCTVLPIGIKGARDYFESRVSLSPKESATFKLFEPIDFSSLSREQMINSEKEIEQEIRDFVEK